MYNTTCPHFFLNLRRLFDKYAVRTEHDALVKSTTKIFSNSEAFSENPDFIMKGFKVKYVFQSLINICFQFRWHFLVHALCFVSNDFCATSQIFERFLATRLLLNISKLSNN